MSYIVANCCRHNTTPIYDSFQFTCTLQITVDLIKGKESGGQYRAVRIKSDVTLLSPSTGGVKSHRRHDIVVLTSVVSRSGSGPRSCRRWTSRFVGIHRPATCRVTGPSSGRRRGRSRIVNAARYQITVDDDIVAASDHLVDGVTAKSTTAAAAIECGGRRLCV